MNMIDLHAAFAVLREGRIVIHPTETCYGLACDLTNPIAVERLFALKRRPWDKPVSALFASTDEAKKYVAWNAEADRMANDNLPGPLTIILPMRENAPLRMHPMPDAQFPQSLGIRVSSHPVAMALAEGYEHPISTTSANLHGQPNPYSLDDIRAQFDADALRDVIMIDGGTLPHNPPSRVVELSGERAIELRKGA